MENTETKIFSHARRGKGCWSNVIMLYCRDPESPSGFLLHDGYTEEEFMILQENGIIPKDIVIRGPRF